jgi:hypothetical protein
MQISQPLYESLFLIAIFTAMFGVLWMPIIWTLLTLFTPKKLLNTYFIEPHFTQNELIFMNRFPFSLARTGIFSWVLIFPSLDKTREIRNCHEVMPFWYKLALQIFIISSMLIMAIFLGILFFLLSVNIA